MYICACTGQHPTHRIILPVRVNFGDPSNTFSSFHTALRALRTLRSISFIRGLQVLVRALIDTFRSAVLHLLLLLFILMFIFAIIGYNFFGYDERGDRRNWGNFGVAMLSLFNFVTVSEASLSLSHVYAETLTHTPSFLLCSYH